MRVGGELTASLSRVVMIGKKRRKKKKKEKKSLTSIGWVHVATMICCVVLSFLAYGNIYLFVQVS